jgi:hypothetical protein
VTRCDPRSTACRCWDRRLAPTELHPRPAGSGRNRSPGLALLRLVRGKRSVAVIQ